jgi:2-methylcitrate dehydratase PrpD
MTARITEELAAFVSGLTDEQVPPEAEAIVTSGVIDTVGVMLAGAGEEVVGILSRTLGEAGGRANGARVCLSDWRLDAPEAALIGATAAHALDYDDVQLSAHPSAVLVPALLAEGEILGSSGRELIRAYVAGFEVWADLFRRNQDYHRKGWHPTAVFGPIGAAAAIAVLRKLPKRETTNALALAASHAGGLVANFGTMTKPYHAGRAAQGGIIAARLAANGMTAAHDALEHGQGFLAAIAPGTPPDRDSPVVAGREWRLLHLGLNIKRYPTCYATHRSIDAIEVTMGVSQASALRNSNPQTGLEAKFSEEFAMASAVVHGKVGLQELTDAVVQQPELRALFGRVKVKTVEEFDPDDPVFSPTEDVVVRLKDGRQLDTRGIRYAKGHAKRPLSSDELWTKFSDCAAAQASPEQAWGLYSRLSNLAGLGSVAEIPSIPGRASRQAA